MEEVDLMDANEDEPFQFAALVETRKAIRTRGVINGAKRLNLRKYKKVMTLSQKISGWIFLEVSGGNPS
ncbi:MAG: hypothetical protein AAF433_02395 [Bacteroidota bacterium]